MVSKKHRYIMTELWQSRWFKKLNNEAKYLYLYLLTNPKSNLCGVYEIMDEQVQFDTGIKDIHKIFEELQRFNEVVRIEDWCIILRYPTNQKWQTSWAIADRIASELDELPEDILDVVRNYDYQYQPIKTDEAFKLEKERIKQMKLRNKKRARPQDQSDQTPQPPKEYPMKPRFKEHVPFG